MPRPCSISSIVSQPSTSGVRPYAGSAIVSESRISQPTESGCSKRYAAVRAVAVLGDETLPRLVDHDAEQELRGRVERRGEEGAVHVLGHAPTDWPIRIPRPSS
jgi:hypothetical protein